MTSSFPWLWSSAARTHSDVVYCVHCLMLSMYCFRGLPHLLFPSMYPSTTFLVIWQPSSLKRCPKYDSNSLFMSSSCRMLLSVLFSIQLIRFILCHFYAKATFPLTLSAVHLASSESKLLLRKTKPSMPMSIFNKKI